MVVGRFIKDLFTEKECKQCELYREMYFQEREEKHALLAHIGIRAIENIGKSSIVDIMAKGYDIADEPEEKPLRRGNTLSEMRRKAEAHYANKKVEPAVVIAPDESLAEAEKRFNEELNKVKH